MGKTIFSIVLTAFLLASFGAPFARAQAIAGSSAAVVLHEQNSISSNISSLQKMALNEQII